jgi:hypothetical protein
MKIKRPRETVAAAVSHPNAENALAKDIDSKIDRTNLSVAYPAIERCKKSKKYIEGI